MPTVTLNKTVLEKLIGRKLSLEKLKDRISYLGTDLEGVEGNEITVEVFPNRPDLLSEQGLGRALASFIGAKKGLKKYSVNNSGESIIVEKAVKTVRPFTVGAIVKNLKLDDEKIRELIQIQEKLHVSFGRNRKKVAIGIYPMENISMPITYTAKKPSEIVFRPLEAEREMNAKEMLSEHSAGREYGHLLDGCDVFPVFIDSEQRVLSVPPIINSDETGKITADTKEAFIEFSGHNLESLQKGLNMLVTCLADMGGSIYSMKIVDGTKKLITPDLNPEKMNLDVRYVNKRLGLELGDKEVKNLLERMGYGVDGKQVLVPAYRSDVIHMVDLIEDIAIAYGYENFNEEIPKVATIGSEDQFELFKNKIATLLIGLKMTEVITFHLCNKDVQNTKMKTVLPLVEVKNPATLEYNMLRAWMIPSLMDVLAGNKHNEYPQEIFDIGSIFKQDAKEESGILEHQRLGVVVAKDKMDYTKIKQVLEYLLRNIGIEFEVEETNHESFIEGRVGRVIVGGKKIGYVGEISPKVLDNFSLETPVGALELNLTELYEIIS